MGYTDTPHNYQVDLPTSWRTVVCIDLKFDEQKVMRVSLESVTGKSVYTELLYPTKVWQLP